MTNTNTIFNVLNEIELDSIERIVNLLNKNRKKAITESLKNMPYELEKALIKEDNKMKDKMHDLYNAQFNNKKEILVYLFTFTFKEIVEKIAKTKSKNVEFMTWEDTLHSAIEWILTYDFEGKAKEGKKASKFEDFNYLLSDFKNLCGQILQREIRIKQKAYSKNGIVNIANVGFMSTMQDKKETMIDMQNELDEKEFECFQLYIQGYKVRDIEKMVKNGRRKYDSMKEIVESYYWLFEENYSQIYVQKEQF